MAMAHLRLQLPFQLDASLSLASIIINSLSYIAIPSITTSHSLQDNPYAHTAPYTL